jgi:hypothetical protein
MEAGGREDFVAWLQVIPISRQSEKFAREAAGGNDRRTSESKGDEAADKAASLESTLLADSRRYVYI